MKIKIEEKNCVVDSRVVVTTTCRAGTAYHRIEYLYNGEVIYSCSSRAMYGTPSTVEALGWEREITVEDPNGQITCSNSPGKKFRAITKTNRELLIEALDNIVIEE